MMRMRLATRQTNTFLAGLAAVLFGFSIALYLLADQHLHRQADEQLEAALNTLVAAAEVGPDGVEWEPQERSLSFGGRAPGGELAWRVADDQGRRVDGSSPGDLDAELGRLGTGAGPRRRSQFHVAATGAGWRAMTRKLDRFPSGGAILPLRAGRHEALVFAAGASMEGVRGNLRNLALTLTGLSASIWIFALIFGGRLCRVALRPVAAMAEAAQGIGGDDLTERLPTTGSGDELDELGRSFNDLLDRLAESLGRQQRFAGDASHQLRTPLTAIRGHVEVALRQDRSPDEYRRVLAVVRSRSQHLCQIIDGLMFLTRADAEAMQPSIERIELDRWLDQHLDAWPHPRHPDVVREYARAGAFQVRVHPPLLGELVGNLLDNAARYSPPGTTIRVKLGRDEGEVTLAVANEGAGIEPADLSRLFVPFFRAEADRVRGSVGTGLGLSVAARIAAAFGGHIRVESGPGRGATFTLALPAGGRAITPSRPPPRSPPESASPAGRG